MSLIRNENDLSSSVNNKFQGRNYVSTYVLGQRSNYPTANVLHDICEFNIQRPLGSPDNYRIYTPTTNTYGLEVVGGAEDSLTGTGVQIVRIKYLDSNWELQSVDINMNGTTPVIVVPNGVRRVNDFHSVQTGTLSVASQDIELRTTLASTIEAPWTGQQILGVLSEGGNKDLTAIFTVPEGKECYLYEVNVSSSNQDQSIRIRSNVDPITRELLQSNCFLFQSVDLIGSNQNATQSLDYLKFPSKSDIKISAAPVATSADTSCHLVMSLIDKQI